MLFSDISSFLYSLGSTAGPAPGPPPPLLTVPWLDGEEGEEDVGEGTMVAVPGIPEEVANCKGRGMGKAGEGLECYQHTLIIHNRYHAPAALRLDIRAHVPTRAFR